CSPLFNRSLNRSFSLPTLCSPSTFTNSVKYTSGGAQSATTLRNTQSVTSSIGASTNSGLVLSQIFISVYCSLFLRRLGERLDKICLLFAKGQSVWLVCVSVLSQKVFPHILSRSPSFIFGRHS